MLRRARVPARETSTECVPRGRSFRFSIVLLASLMCAVSSISVVVGTRSSQHLVSLDLGSLQQSAPLRIRGERGIISLSAAENNDPHRIRFSADALSDNEAFAPARPGALWRMRGCDSGDAGAGWRQRDAKPRNRNEYCIENMLAHYSRGAGISGLRASFGKTMTLRGGGGGVNGSE